MSDAAFDLLTMGRLGVDLYPLQSGVGLEAVESFGKFLGGSAANVAVAAARHGHRTALVSRTGDDPFGAYLHQELRDLAVDDRHVTAVPHLPTPITFCEIFPPDDFPLYFYRYPKAPDLEIRTEELDMEAVRAASIFWVTVTGLSEEPSRAAHHDALTERDRRAHTVIDLDYRPMFWSDADSARREIRAALPRATVAVGNTTECEVAIGTRDPMEAGRRLLDMGVDLAVVKRGPDGVLGITADQTVDVANHPVDIVNGLGAGDAFGGALCHGLLEGWPLERTLRFANVAGAIVASRLECSTAMPSTSEVEAMLEAAGT